MPYGSGVLPDDFVQRLVRLKTASGLTWNGFAEALGVDTKQVLRWRRGTEPCGGAMHSLFRLAPRIPGGPRPAHGERASRCPSGRTDTMPRQRTHYRRTVYAFPADFPDSLERLKETSGLSWSELARRLGDQPPHRQAVAGAGPVPSAQHLLALLDLANQMNPGHLLPRASLQRQP